MRSRAFVLLPILAIMHACGGGGGGGNGANGDNPDGGNPGGGNPPSATVPGSISATVRFDSPTQRFVAAWEPASDAQRYRVLIKPDETTGFAPLSGAGDLASSTLSFTFAVGLTIQWRAAALRVEACNTVGCTASTDLPLLPELVAALATKQILAIPDADALKVACSSNGNVLAVGAPFDSGADGQAPGMGAVFVFTRTGTLWNEQPTILRAMNGEAGDKFGNAVAVSADGARIVVGAPEEDGSTTSRIGNDNDDAPDAGAVYVFALGGSNYDLESYLKARPILDPVIAEDLFGYDVAIAADGRTLVAGAPFAEAPVRPGNFNSGAAFVFTREGSTWTQRASLSGPPIDATEDDQFGLSVATSVDGSTIAVGAPFEDGDALSTSENPNANAPAAGAAYIFTTSNRVDWPRQAYLKAPNAQAGDLLGMTVALSADGNVVAMGATGEDGDAASTLAASNDNLSSAGAIYVFTRTGAIWATTPAYLKASSVSEGADFGESLSLSDNGSVMAIGALFDRSTPPLEGSAFVFVRVGASWLEQIRLVDSAASDNFGQVMLSADGMTLFIGADSGTAAPGAGGVHVH
jgi:hypothetical protein